MFSPESRRGDGRRSSSSGLGLGLGYHEMEGLEIEEGEACDNYHGDDVDDDDDDDEDDENIDPDVDLSYLDEKVQVVLGHFQKDFEGGVSAENLGPKFGGYGSFLPTHQRSPPVSSQPRTPQKVQSYGPSRSPDNLLAEGDYQNSAVSSGPISFARHDAASTSAAPPPISRPPSSDSSSRKEPSFFTTRGTGEFNPKNEHLNKPNHVNDQKTLKVRLKVGTDNMAQKKAAMFSDLGFPLSSPEDSPVGSGGISPEFQESPDGSPTSILQIMTSSPVPDGILLTPLPDSFLHLTKKEKIPRENRFGHACRNSQGNSSMLVEESSSRMAEGKFFGGKKTKPVENSNMLVEMKSEIAKDVGNRIGAPLKKEIDMEIPEGRDFVADSMKPPIASNAKFKIGDTAKGTSRISEVSGEIKKFKVKDRLISSDFGREDANSITNEDVNMAEKLKLRTSTGDKVLEDRKDKVRNGVQSLSEGDGRSKGNKSYDSYNADFDGYNGKKDLHSGTIDPPENKVKLKVTSLERDGGKVPYGTEQTMSGGKKKSKGFATNINLTTGSSQENVRLVSSAASKDKRKGSGDSSLKTKVDDTKVRCEVGKTKEIYRNMFGDEEMEQAENSMNSLGTPIKGRPKDYKLDGIEKATSQFADKPKDRSGVKEMHQYIDRSSAKEVHQFAEKSRERPNGKRFENPLTSENHQKAENVAPTGNGLAPDTVSAPADNWVGCDRCEKWRLLPWGINPEDLPKKWLCSMFTYLPGMNRCNISEEETTKAVMALNALGLESQNNLQNQSNGATAGVTLPEVQRPDHNLLGVANGGKRKHGLKDAADAISFMGPTTISNSINKNQQASLKSRSLNDVNQFPLDSNPTNKADVHHVSKSSDSAVEKQRHKQKDKGKLMQDGGVAHHSKIKSKREYDQEGSRASKKIKTEGPIKTEEDWHSDHGGIVGNSVPTSINCLSAKAYVGGVKKHGEYSSSKESRFDTKENLTSSVKMPKELSQVSLDIDVGRFENKDIAAKKRKVKEWQESQVYPLEPITVTGHHFEANKVALEGTSESELTKGKKARISKYEGKQSCKSIDDARTDKIDRASHILNSSCRDFVADEIEVGKGYAHKDRQQAHHRGANMVSQHVLDSSDPLRRDSGYGLPPMAATSSSSKVSGSRKSKAKVQEAKGSPVESVSSSPMRSSEKSTSARRILLGKDDPTNVGFSVKGSLRRCSDGEGEAMGGHSGSGMKEKPHSVGHRASLESYAHDHQDREVNPTSSRKAKAPTEPSDGEFGNPHSVNGVADTLGQHVQRVELLDKEHGHDDEQVNKQHGSNGYVSRKPGKSLSLRSKDKQKGSKSEFDKGKIKVSDPLDDQDSLYPAKNSRNETGIDPPDYLHRRNESVGGRYNSQEKYGMKGSKDEKGYLGKKDYLGKWSNEGKRENQAKHGGDIRTEVNPNGVCSKDGKSNARQNYTQDRLGERSSHRSHSDRSDHDQSEKAFGRGKSQSFPNTGDKQETQAWCPRPIPSNHRVNGIDTLPVDASSGGGELKVVKPLRKPENQAGAPHNSLRHSTPGRVVGDLGGPSPVRKDSSSQGANAALKEARDLKHSADRLKNSGSDLDSTRLYFEAVLKFLHGASLLEPCNVEAKHGDSQAAHVYSTTTSLCEFVAQEYERCKEMAFAALAYKCLEVACMRVVYFRHWSVNKDRHELQTALHTIPPGESPSSSASDVDNLNNQGTVDKVALAKGVGSPHITGNHVIAARNRPNFVRVLNFTNDVNSAMEASRKSYGAFVAASASLGESQYESILFVKRALDFSFHDVQGLLRLVRLAMEAISR